MGATLRAQNYIIYMDGGGEEKRVSWVKGGSQRLPRSRGGPWDRFFGAYLVLVRIKIKINRRANAKQRNRKTYAVQGFEATDEYRKNIVRRTRNAQVVSSNLTSSSTSGQTPLCSDVFLSSEQKERIGPLPFPVVKVEPAPLGFDFAAALPARFKRYIA